MPDSFGRRLLDNAAISAVLQLASSLVVLAMTPLVLARIGLSAYGFWALMMTIVRYSLIADLGIGPSVTKHVAASDARGDRAAIRAAATVGTLYYVGLSALVMLVATVGGPVLLSHVKMSPELHRDAPKLLVGFAGYFAFNIVAWSSFSATLNGLGLLRVTALANAIGTLAYAATIALTLAHGSGVPGLLLGSFVQIAVAATIGHVVVWRRCGGTLCNPLRIEPAFVRTMLGFGGWLQISTVASLLNSETPPLVLATFAGVESVALYDIGSRLARCVRALAYHCNGALLPAISAIETRGDAERTVAAIAAAHRFMALTSFGAMGFLIASAPIVLSVWLGAGVANAQAVYAVVAVLALVYLVENFVTVVITGLRGRGKPRLEAWYAVSYALADVALSLALAPRFGLAGVLAALGVGVALGTTLFVCAAVRTGTAPVAQFAGFWIVRLATATAVATGMTSVLVRALRAVPLSRETSAAMLCVLGVAYCCTFVAALWLVRFLSSRDLSLARRVFPLRLAPLLDLRLTRKLFRES